MAYLKKMKAMKMMDITYLEKEDIPINCPYGSSLDFFGFGYLKQEISNRQPRTLEEIWKIAQEVWSSIDLAMIERTFSDWKRCLHKISVVHGEHFKQIKYIHSKLLK